MKWKVMTAAALTLCLLTGCGEDDVASANTEAVTGTWVRTMLDGTETLTLNPDMTYDKVINLGGDVPLTSTSHDKWSLKGDTISIVYSDFNTTSDYKITISGNTMTWDNGNAQLVYTKK